MIMAETNGKRAAEQTKPEQKKPQCASKAEKVIYLGPPMMERSKDGQVVFSIGYGTVYSDGLPVEVTERQKQDKNFAKLFVPVSSAAAAMKHLMKPDSELSEANNKVKKDYLERKKGGR
jgi:hypothetical protein